MTTFKGLDVLDQVRPDAGDMMTDQFRRSVKRIDTRITKRYVSAQSVAPIITRPFLWFADGRTEITKLRTFLTARKGRVVPFWVPTYKSDLIQSYDVNSIDTQLTIRFCEYSRLVYQSAARRYIAFINKSTGAFTCLKVTAAVDNGDGTETLNLESAVGTAYPKASTMISYLTLCRLDDDVSTIIWHSGAFAEAALQFTEVPAEVTV